MARPYGLVQRGGEGTYGGLRGLVATPDLINTYGANWGMLPIDQGSSVQLPRSPFDTSVDTSVSSEVPWLWNQIYNNVGMASEAPSPSQGMTIAEWLNANKTLTFVVVGGVIGLMLFRR